MEAASVSIQDTYLAMSEILYGHSTPNVKLAYWSAALSSRMHLHLNGRYTRILANYVTTPLPAREELLDELGRSVGAKFPQGVMSSHINLIYEIERLDGLGLLHFPTSNATLQEQQEWRRGTVALIKGMGCKLVSWAYFIYSPFDCKLLTIDCHHCSRLGVEQTSLSGSSAKKQAFYNQVEARMLAECTGLYPEYPPVITAAMLWQNHRLATGKCTVEGYESHKALSCRWY